MTTTSKNGRLSMLGISYENDMIPPRNASRLGEADVVIGHEAFISAVRPMLNPRAEAFDVLDNVTDEHDFRELRVRAAWDAARAGKRVVLVSSGDPGIWGMAAYALSARSSAESGIEVEVLPAITAFQTAAAQVGAPLMNGFAACSLCDDITPTQVIAARLGAAAAGDFVTVVYKPRYNAEAYPEQFPEDRFPQFHPPRLRSDEQLTRLADTFLAARAPATPVVIAADLGTPAQKTLVISLGTLRDHLDDISLTSLLIIGNSETVLCGDLLTVRR